MISLVSCSISAESRSIRSDDDPLPVSCAVGQSVVLPCWSTFNTTVQWSRLSQVATPSTDNPVGDIIVTDGQVVDQFADRFSRSDDDANGFQNLTISECRPSDAATYTCIENNGNCARNYVRLTVSGELCRLVDHL